MHAITILSALAEPTRLAAHISKAHLRKLINDHFVKENELRDRVMVARVIQKVVDRGFAASEFRTSCGTFGMNRRKA